MQNNYQNTKEILLGETQAALNYIDRLLFTVQNLSAVHTKLELKEEFNLLLRKISLGVVDFWEIEALQKNFQKDAVKSDYNSLKKYLKAGQNILMGLADLDLNSEELVELGTEYINLLYHYGFDLHRFLKSSSELEVPYPRLGIISMVNFDNEEIPYFSTSKERITDCEGTSEFLVSSLQKQRDKKYQDQISKGHQAIFNKSYTLALDHFEKALNLKTSAEALTLVGWAMAFLNQYDKAKNFCLKAIQADPEYGPPYNDLGTYLFKEGRVEESMKWFTLAKKAAVYENREFPYINAARVHLAQANYESALEEFNKAHMLAPFNKEVIETVEKLRKLIENQKDKELGNAQWPTQWT